MEIKTEKQRIMKSIDEEYWREHDRVIDDGYGDMEGTVFVYTALSIVLVILIVILISLSIIQS